MFRFSSSGFGLRPTAEELQVSVNELGKSGPGNTLTDKVQTRAAAAQHLRVADGQTVIFGTRGGVSVSVSGSSRIR